MFAIFLCVENRQKTWDESILRLRDANKGLVYTPVEMLWHTVTHGRGSEGETGEWSG
jgi:hypothetical protein